MSQQQKLNVAVLGATGVVGQVFVRMLHDHPRFNLSVLAGSKSRAGKYYGEEVHWVLPDSPPESVSTMKLDPIEIDILKQKKVDIVFSAPPAEVAKTLEPVLRDEGFHVFSNAGALRYEENTPILIPEVNPESLTLIQKQGYPSKGFVVTNANCSTTGLATALAPLRTFGIKEVTVSTYQSVSGAGHPGMPALDIMGNVVPHIAKEEEKMVIELQKIFQRDIDVYPFCVRVPVRYGHLETVWVTFDQSVETKNILDAWKNFTFDNAGLPTMPKQPVVYCDKSAFPQPRMSFQGTPAGMQVFTGGLRKEKKRIGFTLLVNNLVKGAAGGSIANAELYLKTYGE